MADGNEVMAACSSVGGVCAKNLAKDGGAYVNTNDEANGDKTETPSPMVEGVDIGNYTALSGEMKVIEHNASSTLVEHKTNQPEKYVQ